MGGGFPCTDINVIVHNNIITRYYTIIAESRDYAPPPPPPPPVHASIWAKAGRGLIRGILTFPCDDHYRPSKATLAHDLSGCLVGEKRSSKAYYDTIASLCF